MKRARDEVVDLCGEESTTDEKKPTPTPPMVKEAGHTVITDLTQWLRAPHGKGKKPKNPPPAAPIVDVPTPWAAMGSALDPRQIWLRWEPDCNGRNAHVRDSMIFFDDGVDPATGQRKHDYLVDGVKNPGISATSVVHHYWPAFDRDAVAKQTAQRHATEQPEEGKPPPRKKARTKYTDKSPEQIKAMWTGTQEFGTARHLAMELYLSREPGCVHHPHPW